MFTGGFEFKKVEVEHKSAGCRKPRTVHIAVDKKDGKGRKVVISSDVFLESNINIGDKVDLLQCGKMFAFQKSSAGLLRVTQNGNTGCINSMDLCRHLRAETKGCNEYDAWVDNDMIIFKPVDEHRTL